MCNDNSLPNYDIQLMRCHSLLYIYTTIPLLILINRSISIKTSTQSSAHHKYDYNINESISQTYNLNKIMYYINYIIIQ